MRRRFATAVLLLLLAGLQYRLWLGDGGLLDNRRLQQGVQRQENENTELERRNSRLEAEVDDLRKGGAAIEAHARTELGMIRKGETFYLVVEPNR